MRHFRPLLEGLKWLKFKHIPTSLQAIDKLGMNYLQLRKMDSGYNLRTARIYNKRKILNLADWTDNKEFVFGPYV